MLLVLWLKASAKHLHCTENELKNQDPCYKFNIMPITAVKLNCFQIPFILKGCNFAKKSGLLTFL